MFLVIIFIRIPEEYNENKEIKMLPTLWRYIEFSGGKRKPNV